VYGRSRPALARLGRALGAALRTLRIETPVAVRPAPPRVAHWDTEWAHHLRPVRLSRSLTLVPTTWAGPVEPGGRALHLEPAMAFGFGEHPTTRLAARAIERACAGRRGASLLDVGTGSGVLSIVAAASGAGRVVGLDVDPIAVRAARGNAARNGVGALCRFSTRPVAKVRRRFDLVVANIDAATLDALAPSLVRVLAPRGVMLLTGLLDEQRRAVVTRYREAGMSVTRSAREGEWVLVTLARRPARGARRPRARRAPGTSRTPRSRSAARRA
jgi:ribosomal protein L11 methyltransferase